MLLTMLALQIAGSFAGAAPKTGASSWLSDDDYPAGALRARAQGPVRVVLLIDPKGRVSDCTVTVSSNSADLDNATCRILKARMKFDPARDGSGAPIAAAWTTGMVWVPPRSDSAPPGSLPYDILFPVNHLPAKLTAPIIRIEQLLGADGSVEDCHVTKESGSPQLDALACETAKAQLPFPKPVPADEQQRLVVSQTIAFVVRP